MRLAHYLDLDALSSDIVENQLGARCPFGIYSSSNAALDIFEVLPWLEVFVLLQKVTKVGGNLKFVGVRVGLLDLAKLLDFGASYLIVLLIIRSATCFAWSFELIASRGRTLGVKLLSSSSTEVFFATFGGAAAALAFFFSSCSRCLMRFFNSVLLQRVSVESVATLCEPT